MPNFIVDFFKYDFLIRALLVGLAVSLSASLLGVSLVLKRYSMIGDGLSHVGFGSLAIATALGASPMIVTLPVVILAAFLLLRISESGKIRGDAAIAMISTGSMAAGVLFISVTSGVNTDIYNYMFGSILSMSESDVVLSLILSAIVLTLYSLFYHKIFAVTFDENFARATGVNAGAYNSLLAVLSAVTIVLGMRIMGALLISSLIIFPALTAMRLMKSFRSVTLTAAIISGLCFLIGLFSSYALALPTGATIVCVNILAFILFSAISFLKSNLTGKSVKQQP